MTYRYTANQIAKMMHFGWKSWCDVPWTWYEQFCCVTLSHNHYLEGTSQNQQSCLAMSFCNLPSKQMLGRTFLLNSHFLNFSHYFWHFYTCTMECNNMKNIIQKLTQLSSFCLLQQGFSFTFNLYLYLIWIPVFWMWSDDTLNKLVCFNITSVFIGPYLYCRLCFGKFLFKL